MPSAKGAAHHIHNDLPRRVQREYSLASAHSNTGGRRNPGRRDGRAWNGDSFICPGQVDLDNPSVDPFMDSCTINVGDFDDCDYRNLEVTGPRTVEISLADVPMKVCKPKRRKW